MKHRIPIIALTLLMTAYLFAETPTDSPTTEPSTGQRVEELIRQRRCAENLRQIAEAMRQYANDDTDPFPTLTVPLFQNPTTQPATQPGNPKERRDTRTAEIEYLKRQIVEARLDETRARAALENLKKQIDSGKVGEHPKVVQLWDLDLTLRALRARETELSALHKNALQKIGGPKQVREIESHLNNVRKQIAERKKLVLERETAALLQVHEMQLAAATAQLLKIQNRYDKLVKHPAATQPAVSQVSYEEAFADLYETLGREYPCFDLKKIDWKAVGKELLPQAKQVKTDEQFGLLCMKLVARLEDSHAHLRKGKVKPPSAPFPRWDPGLTCLIDDRGKPVVYYIDKDSPAEKAGVKIGMTVLSVNGKPAEQVLKDFMSRQSMYWGYSSQRYLKYHAARFFIRQMKKGDAVTLEMQEPSGRIRTFKLPATLGVRYLRRLPVPIKGISDSANVSWTMLDNDIGYIYVRRIRRDLIKSLDRAVAELKDARGLIIDVRGNSGGGFNARRAHRNFALNDNEEPKRPRFKRPMALLTDSRCISAGEGWASWFIARKRAKVFGSATAGASSRKRTYTLKNGLYKVTFPVKAYRGFLDRPIERRGLEPDVKVRQSAQDLAAGRDTVLQAARKYLVSAATSAPAVDPEVMAILKRLETAGDKYPNITAKIDYKVDMLQTGDTEERTGRVYYQGPGGKESAKFRIHFDTLRQGTGPKIRDVVDYAFDGAWLTVRKQRIKQMSRYQVAPPGEKVNPLQLGKGPFPVPFGQKADAVIKHFRATTRPAGKTDPKNTDYIKLTTRRRYRKEFSVVWLEMWIDRKTSLPVKIVAEDRSENQTTVLFKDTKTPKSFPKKTFDLPRPPAGWEYHVERFKGQVKP